jgi:predicted nucleic acid-binding protein
VTVLVDTSVWIGHLRVSDPTLSSLLDKAAVLSHPWIIGEIALGHLRNRADILGLLGALPKAVVASDDEVRSLLEHEPLHGTGIGYVDAQILASARLTPGARTWTRDQRLARQAARLGRGFDQVAG